MIILEKYSIKIKFVNVIEEVLPLQLMKFLTKESLFYYNDISTIRDLFKWIMISIWGEDEHLDDENLIEHIYAVLNGQAIKVQLDYNLKQFITINHISVLKLLYVMCGSGGAGAYIKLLGEIRINPNEQCHKYIPHVHVYKNGKINDNSCVRIKLDDLSQMYNDSIKIDKLFSKKQKKILFDFLKKYQGELVDYYNSIQRGEYPKPIYIDYNGNKVDFK